jgi:hypothetical protein
MRGWGLLGCAFVALMLFAGVAQAATFTVTTQLDSNDGHCTVSKCSLRDAVIASNNAPGSGANVIDLKAGDYKLTLAGTNEDASATGDLDVIRSVSIKGAGAATTKIDGNHIDRVFDISLYANFAVSGLTITGGSSVPTSSGTYSLGGGVYNETSGSVTFTDAAVNNNTTTGGIGGVGAGIESYGPVSLINTTASGNQVGDRATGQHGSGGVISMANASTVTLTRFTATNNHAGGNGGSGSGGAVDAQDSQVTVTSSTFTGNTAGGGSAGLGFGGAMDAKSATISGSTFRGNSAGGGGGAGFGGALDVGNGTLTNSVVSGNTAGGGFTADSNGIGNGGGIDGNFTVVRSTISGNTAGGQDISGDGGGIFSGGDSSFTNSTIFGNTAGGGGSNGTGRGGGIEDEGTATLSYTDVVGNTATSEPGSTGGGISGGSITSQGSILANNTAASGPNCDVTATSGGHNLETGTSCGFASPGDIVAAAGVGSLANNGGPTPTLRLLAGSLAIDRGGSTGCPATDQRGVKRPQGSACDIGSYEVALPAAVTGGASIGRSHHVTLHGSASNPGAAAGTALFVYGKTTSYGKTSSAVPVPVGAASRAIAVSVGGLKAGTLYHYRLIVRNTDGNSIGVDNIFQTPDAPKLSKVHVKRLKSGFSVFYVDSEAGSVAFSVLHKGNKVRSFTHSGKAGQHKVKFGKGLPAGSYELKAVAKNAFGSSSRAVVKRFRVS